MVTETDEVVSDDDVTDCLCVVVVVADCDWSCISFVALEICVRQTDLSSDSLKLYFVLYCKNTCSYQPVCLK